MKLNRDIGRVIRRKMILDKSITQGVQNILDDVRENGDKAVRKYALTFDSFSGLDLKVSQTEIKNAVNSVSFDYKELLCNAVANIEEFHKNQIERSWGVFRDDNVMMGQIIRPLNRVALYVPSGAVPLPSSLLMCAIPAKIAGVKEIVILAAAKEEGNIAESILAAASICGISEIYKVGGVQSIGAVAYGTETIPKVDKIVGPGGIYVTIAKRLVYGDVDIDKIAGPSDILIIADETANPRYIAADLLGQAEHDILASAVLVTNNEALIIATEKEIERQLPMLERKNIIRQSLENYGVAILVDNLDKAFDVSNEVAPEHLEVLTRNPLEHLPKIHNAGSIFLGENTPESLGDYMSGPNHVLPTEGTSRFYSPLGVYDFIKYSTYSYFPRSAFEKLANRVIDFAEIEGLQAHANTVKIRLD